MWFLYKFLVQVVFLSFLPRGEGGGLLALVIRYKKKIFGGGGRGMKEKGKGESKVG